MDTPEQNRRTNELPAPASGAAPLPAGNGHLPAEQSADLRFESAGARIPVRLVASSDLLLEAAADDFCWRLAMGALLAARPGRQSQQVRDAWLVRYRELIRERDRLRQIVKDALGSV